MFEELISKKELLKVMDISYGQLYRWKRKKLIPQEWFIKKSVSTGQETFFPREKTIQRIKDIIELKDEKSLDELADRFSGFKRDIKLDKNYLKDVIANEIIKMFEENIVEPKDIYEDKDIFVLFIYNKLIKLGSLSLSEVNEISKVIYRDYDKLKDKEYEVIIKRKLGVCYYYLILDKTELFIDKENSIEIARININELIEEIRKI